jgi:hypothetical protein
VGQGPPPIQRNTVRAVAGTGAAGRAGRGREVRHDGGRDPNVRRPSSALADVAKTGWTLPSELKEPDFDALRGCPDFQMLVAEKAEKPPETAPTLREKK